MEIGHEPVVPPENEYNSRIEIPAVHNVGQVLESFSRCCYFGLCISIFYLISIGYFLSSIEAGCGQYW